MVQWLGQQVYEAVGPGSNPSLYLHFLNFINMFRDQNLSGTKMGSPAMYFGTVGRIKISTEKRDTQPSPNQ